MDRRLARDLDNYITGHYGEDQFRNDDSEEEKEDKMTVWQLEEGDKTIGLFTSEAVAMDSLTYSYHKRHVKIEREPTNLVSDNDYQITIIEDEKNVDLFRLHEVMVHSSRCHL